MDFKERTIYAKLSIDEKTGKKKVWFGGAWGDMAKEDANAVAFKTGNGLVVVDIDVQDLKDVSKDMRKQLKKLGSPTVKTARGMHYYFEHSNSKEFTNKASYSKHVDVRSDGGIIFAQYRGRDKRIAYERTGKIHKTMPKGLRKILLRDMQTSTKKRNDREQWTKIESGEIHDGTLSYAMRDFKAGLSLDEVILRGVEYVNSYLGGTQREIKLMMDRIKWGYSKKINDDLDEVEKDRDNGISMEDLDEEGITMLLVEAHKVSAMELEKVMKDIKKKTKLSIATLKQMLKDAPKSQSSIGEYFNGDLFWDGDIGCYIEVYGGGEATHLYKKQNFTQTVMSASGWMTPSDVNEILHTVPKKHMVYRPDLPFGECADRWGEPAYNMFKRQEFKGKGKKMPKTIKKVLRNLFSDQPEALEDFINWMAVIVQHNIRTGVAWGFFGASGSGKGLISDIMRELVGHRNASMNVGDNELQSTFNGYAMNKLFIHLNEVASDFHGRHGVAGKLKALIGDGFIRINQKGISEVEFNNCANIILNSNKPNPIELDHDDRRWNMIVTKTALTQLDWWKGDDSYQKAMSEADEFGAWLMNYKCDVQRACRPMEMSDAKRSVIEQTTSPLQLVANAMRKGDEDKIMEMLGFDESDSSMDVTYKGIVKACEDGKWSNSLIKSIYLIIRGKDNATAMDVSRFFIKPFISKEASVVWKVDGEPIRGYTFLNI